MEEEVPCGLPILRRMLFLSKVVALFNLKNPTFLFNCIYKKKTIRNVEIRALQLI